MRYTYADNYYGAAAKIGRNFKNMYYGRFKLDLLMFILPYKQFCTTTNIFLIDFSISGGASYLNAEGKYQPNIHRPYPYADDCFGALCPWWLPPKGATSTPGSGIQDSDSVDCAGDCIKVIGEDNDGNAPQNGIAFPKTRYQVEGKPNGISVLQARKSFLKKQLGSKGSRISLKLDGQIVFGIIGSNSFTKFILIRLFL